MLYALVCVCVPCPILGSVSGGDGGRGPHVAVVISADCPVVCAVIVGLSANCPLAVEEVHNNTSVNHSESRHIIF